MRLLREALGAKEDETVLVAANRLWRERSQARNAALEEAAVRCDAMTSEVKGWTSRAPSRITAYCADEIRALKVQP